MSTNRAVATKISWRQRLFEIGAAGALLVLLVPAMIIQGLLIEFPRQMWRTVRWSRDAQLADALPNSASHAARQAKVARLLEEVGALSAEQVASRAATLPLVAETELRDFVDRAPAQVRDELRTLRSRAMMAVTRRAEQVAPQLVGEDYALWGMPFVSDPAWVNAQRAAESAVSAAWLGRALDELASRRWAAAWNQLTRAE